MSEMKKEKIVFTQLKIVHSTFIKIEVFIF